MNYYRDDIHTFFPEFEGRTGDTAYLVCLDSEAVGIVIGKQIGNDTLDLYLDYSTPAYRDCSVGTFLYPELAGRGFKTLVYSGGNPAHTNYLNKMGFTKDENGVFTLKP
jgi:hypothetical protein